MNVTITCDRCNHIVEIPSIGLHDVSMADGTVQHWCSECCRQHAYHCEHCGGYSEVACDVWTVHGWHYRRECWCPDCANENAVECTDCGDRLDRQYVHFCTLYTGEEVTLCPSCRENYVSCDRCCRLVPEDERRWDDEGWNVYCPDCYEQVYALHRYGHTYGNVFWQDDETGVDADFMTDEQRKQMYFGIELETDYNDDAYELARDLMDEFSEDKIVCKRDGSLNDNGVEIVSQPMTPNYHLRSGMWDRIAEIVRNEHGGKSHEAGTCGLHIHISRDALESHDVVYRMDRLLHRFKCQFVKFSRRRDFRYCALEDDDLADIKSLAERKKRWADKKEWEREHYEGRYVALNDKNNSTVELRLWRGTLNMETFKATVEMTAGLVYICNAMTDEFADALTWSMVKVLVRFALEQNGIGHEELDSYLVRRGL